MGKPAGGANQSSIIIRNGEWVSNRSAGTTKRLAWAAAPRWGWAAASILDTRLSIPASNRCAGYGRPLTGVQALHAPGGG